ncbi:hypothetical protein HK405_004648 [Cladochytrium tenue]|nr:hypothetical protein HK405_004648 [Cladochytrium tenue]
MHIVVVGAGTGGVSTAALLARKGHRVTVLERNRFSGGRCSLVDCPEPGTQNGMFHFDQGPSLFLMPPSFRRLFAELGADLDALVPLKRCDPVAYALHFGTDPSRGTETGDDCNVLRLSGDLVRMRTELERVEPGAYASFLAFLSEAREYYDLSVEHVLEENFDTWASLLMPKMLPLALRLRVLTTMWDRVCKFFKSDKLRRAFTFQAMYLGMNPYEAPGTYNLLQYSEYSEGIWYPEKGFHSVIAAIEKIAKDHGATFQFGADVKKIHIDPRTKKATGVEYVLRDPDGGEQNVFLDADAVICNADAVYAYSKLFDHPATLERTWLASWPLRTIVPSFLPNSVTYTGRINAMSKSCSTFSFYWGLKRKVPELEPHNIFLPAEDYRGSFDAIFKGKTLPEVPSFYVHCPTKLDQSLAPPGKECLVVLVPVGHLSDADAALLSKPKDECTAAELLQRKQRLDHWEGMQRRARRQVLDILSTKLGIDIEGLIEVEETNTPITWMNKFNLAGGAALGLSHPVSQVLWLRPRTRHATVGNLFFVGASVHPGTGVPIVMHGARLVAKQVHEAAQHAFTYRTSAADARRLWVASVLALAVLVPLLALVAAALSSVVSEGALSPMLRGVGGAAESMRA